MDPFENGGYPAFYESTDRLSLEGQNRFNWALRLRLLGLVIATIGSGVILAYGLISVGAWLAIGGFLLAILIEAWLAVDKPDRSWYEGRAAAESAKTLTWRYAVRGESFNTDENIDSSFRAQIGNLLQDLRDLDLPSSVLADSQITDDMREVRSKPFESRKEIYREGRIETQRKWYSDKASFNRTRARRWSITVFSIEGLGVIGGLFLLTGILPIDFISLAAIIAAAITAWTQARQYKTLAVAYGVTAQELASVKNELDGIVQESDWPYFVGQAEEAISREHTLWRASRGVR